jgi:uncharacterized protein (UPF0548 family)
VAGAIRLVQDGPGWGPRLLSLSSGLEGSKLPFGFVHDRLRSRLGQGPAAFAAARRAFARWAEFDLGWVRVANPAIPIAVGQIVAVEVHALGLWSLNLSRIAEMADTETQFGFLYATTAHHAEEGEERFLLEFDPEDGGVWYHLEAVSRPHHSLARAAYPVTRALQHRFARDSHARMERAVLSDPGL